MSLTDLEGLNWDKSVIIAVGVLEQT